MAANGTDPRLIVRSIRPGPPPQKQIHRNKGAGEDFKKILREKVGDLDGLRFSAHALRRLQSRQIQLSQNEQEQLVDAVNKAAEKGSKDSLILLRRLAFVVNVPNRTVVTAMDPAQMGEGIITNIDSAMIVNQK